MSTPSIDADITKGYILDMDTEISSSDDLKRTNESLAQEKRH